MSLHFNNKIRLILLCALVLNVGLLKAQAIHPINSSNESKVKNTQLFYFNIIDDITSEYGRDFFKPYLSYKVRGDNRYEGKMMDSFVFLDISYQNNGTYEKNMWDNYLDNVFVRTKLPIIRTDGGSNNCGYVGRFHRSSISRDLSFAEGDGSVKFTADIKVGKQSDSKDTGQEIIVGIEFFDKENKKIKEGNFSDGLSMTYAYINIDRNESSWQKISVDIPIPQTASHGKLHIMNWHLKEEFLVDNVLLTNTTDRPYLDIQESQFNTPLATTDWEFQKRVWRKYLFKNRNALCTELDMAAKSLFPHDETTIKLILTIPEVTPENYSTENKKKELKAGLRDFAEQANSKFTEWKKSNPGNRIEIAGLYYIDENLREDEVAFYTEIFDDLKSITNSLGWKLFASPYNKFYHPNIELAYTDAILSQFEVVWMQPNAFYTGRYGNIERDMLKQANQMMADKRLAANIENRVVEEDEPYGRINDYFDYGEKYGYINYAKMYYDDGGAHWVNAHSNDYKKRVDYENLYRFIEKARIGVLVNGSFECFDDKDMTKLHNWDGTYTIQEHDYSFNHERKTSFVTNGKTAIHSQKYPIKADEDYFMLISANNLTKGQGVGNAFVGIKFYDIKGNLIENMTPLGLKYSSKFKCYYKNLETSIESKRFVVNFQTPPNAFFFDLMIQKDGKSGIEWSSILFSESKEVTNPKRVFIRKGSSMLEIDDDNNLGNYSIKLDKGQHIVSTNKMPIVTVPYNFSFFIKSEGIAQDNALIVFELYDDQGLKLEADLLLRLANIGNTWNKKEHTINFPKEAKSIKLHLKNEYNESSILFDNLELSVVNESNLDRTIGVENLLVNSCWGMKLPLEVAYKRPVQYLQFVDVRSSPNLLFTALMKGVDHKFTSSKDRIVLELFDENYNPITSKDSGTGAQNLKYVDEYAYWEVALPLLNSINPVDYFEADKDGYALPNWYTDQWRQVSVPFSVPSNAKYLKLSLHKLTEGGHYKILNPSLSSESR